MLLARIMYPVETLGPGKRIALWVCGCHRRCPHCANPELQPFDSTYEISVDELAQALLPLCTAADGLTIIGGEPFEQAGALCELIEILKMKDVLISTGYTLEQLLEKKDCKVHQLLKMTSVLVYASPATKKP